MLRTILTASFLTLAILPAWADSCSAVLPGARMGPDPNFNRWPWDGACYVAWPGGYIGGMNARLTYEPKCKAVPGYLHFEGDYGSNSNVCVFKPQAAAPVERRNTVPPVVKQDGPKPFDQFLERAGREVIDPMEMFPDHYAGPPVTDWPKANEAMERAKESYRDRRYTLSEVYFLSPLGLISSSDTDIRARNARQYAKCMSGLSVVFKQYYRDNIYDQYDVQFARARCKDVVGEFVDEGIARIRDLQREREAKANPEPARVAPAPAQAPPQVVDNRCLVVREPRDTGVGCGNGRTWKMTHVGISTATSNRCPGSVRFLYTDENGPELAEAPTTLQTCGDPPLNVKAR